MNTEPFTIERTFNVPVALVWKAITNKEDMKKWYFDLAEFKPEKGFKFQFVGGPPETQYTHLCEVTEVIKEKKISYSWCYKGYEGYSEVTFELFENGNKTTLKLTHSGIESFPKIPDFAPQNFAEGWTYIIGTSLDKFLQSE
ncbi:MAG TPA: SRPBCC domain-containing protein [Bacteroidia bacterium]|nr:SRPBCC domain-containing protein [Bacteroidia bacterium]